MLACGGLEQEDRVMSGTDLINVTIFVCPVYCFL